MFADSACVSSASAWMKNCLWKWALCDVTNAAWSVDDNTDVSFSFLPVGKKRIKAAVLVGRSSYFFFLQDGANRGLSVLILHQFFSCVSSNIHNCSPCDLKMGFIKDSQHLNPPFPPFLFRHNTTKRIKTRASEKQFLTPAQRSDVAALPHPPTSLLAQ